MGALLRRQRRATLREDQEGRVRVPAAILGPDLRQRQGLYPADAQGRPQAAHHLRPGAGPPVAGGGDQVASYYRASDAAPRDESHAGEAEDEGGLPCRAGFGAYGQGHGLMIDMLHPLRRSYATAQSAERSEATTAQREEARTAQ